MKNRLLATLLSAATVGCMGIDSSTLPEPTTQTTSKAIKIGLPNPIIRPGTIEPTECHTMQLEWTGKTPVDKFNHFIFHSTPEGEFLSIRNNNAIKVFRRQLEGEAMAYVNQLPNGSHLDSRFVQWRDNITKEWRLGNQVLDTDLNIDFYRFSDGTTPITYVGSHCERFGEYNEAQFAEGNEKTDPLLFTPVRNELIATLGESPELEKDKIYSIDGLLLLVGETTEDSPIGAKKVQIAYDGTSLRLEYENTIPEELEEELYGWRLEKGLINMPQDLAFCIQTGSRLYDKTRYAIRTSLQSMQGEEQKQATDRALLALYKHTRPKF